MKHRKNVIFLLVLLFFGFLFFFRYPLGTKIFLSNTLSKTCSYKSFKVSNHKIVIQELQCFDKQIQMILDGIELEGDFRKILFHPHHMVTLSRQGFSNWFDVVALMKKYGLKLGIQKGGLSLAKEHYYFQFSAGNKENEIGTLFISLDPCPMDHPSIAIRFYTQTEQIFAQFSMHEASLEKFFPLCVTMFPQYFSNFSNAQGTVTLQANAMFKENGKIKGFSTNFSLKDFQLSDSVNELVLQMDTLQGEVASSSKVEEVSFPVWEKIQCALHLSNGSIHLGKQFSLSKLEGAIALGMKESANVLLTGEITGQEMPLYLELAGKGSTYEDLTHFLEFGLKLKDLSGTTCNAFLSISYPQKEMLTLQVEAMNLFPEQMEMLKGYFAKSMPRLENWKILQGNFGGKFVALYEKGNFSHFEIQSFLGEKVLLSFADESFYLENIKGEGRLFSSLHFEMKIPTMQFFGYISPTLKDVYAIQYPEDFTHMHGTIRYNERDIETAASVDFLSLGESLQFGFKSTEAFPCSIEEIKEGWIRSEKLSQHIYGPLIKAFHEDISLYGNIDFLATYDGNVLESALQIDHFLVKHPLLDMKAQSVGEKEKTLGRMKLTYNPKTQYFEGQFPLQKGEVYDRRYGIYFTQVEGDFHFTASKFLGHVSHADVSWDSFELLKGLSLCFSLEEQFHFQDMEAQLVLPSDYIYTVSVSKWDPKSCDVHLFQEKQELAHFKGEKKEKWQGMVALPLLGQTIPLAFHWDYVQGTAGIEIQDENFSLKARKEDKNYILEQLAFENVVANGSFIIGDQALEAQQLEIKTPKMDLIGVGNIHLKLPKKKEGFGLYGLLDCQLHTLFPFPLQWKGSQPIMWAFSPEMGFVLSGMHLEAPGCHLEIDHFEHLLNGKQSAHQIAFAMDEEFMEHIFDTGMFPTFLRDFRVCKNLVGKANFNQEKEAITIQALLASKKGNIGVDVDWKEKKGVFSIGQEEKLHFHTHIEDNAFRFDSIQGTFGRLSSDLKTNRKGKLKGNVHIDFSLFDEVFDLPLNRFVQLWKAGTGYQFEGTFFPSQRLFDWGFKGKVKGDSFECGGYKFRSLEAKVEVFPDQVTIENLDVIDDAGRMWIEEGSLMKSKQTGEWVFFFPLVEIRGFQPSFLQKISTSPHVVNPLILKTATLRDVRGKIDELSSITCQGNLRFTNRLKGKEKASFSMKELKVGDLKEEKIIPVTGEMEYFIQDAKIYLREIRNMVSENNHLEFLPPKNTAMGYLDFEGNLFIDLWVRQKAVQSLSSPHSLKIRGTWENPQISIQ